MGKGVSYSSPPNTPHYVSNLDLRSGVALQEAGAAAPMIFQAIKRERKRRKKEYGEERAGSCKSIIPLFFHLKRKQTYPWVILPPPSHQNTLTPPLIMIPFIQTQHVSGVFVYFCYVPSHFLYVFYTPTTRPQFMPCQPQNSLSPNCPKFSISVNV